MGAGHLQLRQRAVCDGGELSPALVDDGSVPQRRIGCDTRFPLGENVGARRRHGEPAFDAAGRDVGEGGVQLRGRGCEISADLQRGRAVDAGSHLERAEDVVWSIVEVGVDVDLLPVDEPRGDALPGRVRGLGAGFASTKDEEIRDGFGAGGATVCPSGQAHRAHQVGHVAHLAAGGGVLRVEREPACQHGDEPARARKGEGLDDEVVVQRVPATVVRGAVGRDVGERDVADRGVERCPRKAGVRERLGAHICGRIEPARDGGGERVKRDTGHLGAHRRHAHEWPRAATRLEHAPALEAEALHRRPHGVDVSGVGVVRVDGRAARGGELRVRQEALQLLPFTRPVVAAFVEHLRDGAPTRPARERGLFIGGSRPLLCIEPTNGLDGGDVRLEARLDTRGCQIVLRGRTEAQYPSGTFASSSTIRANVCCICARRSSYTAVSSAESGSL